MILLTKSRDLMISKECLKKKSQNNRYVNAIYSRPFLIKETELAFSVLFRNSKFFKFGLIKTFFD